MDWKVDVVVASELLNRVAVPTVLVALQLSDGRVLTYRLSTEELHQWRYSLAKGVKDLAYLEKKRPPAASKSRRKK